MFVVKTNVMAKGTWQAKLVEQVILGVMIHAHVGHRDYFKKSQY